MKSRRFVTDRTEGEIRMVREIKSVGQKGTETTRKGERGRSTRKKLKNKKSKREREKKKQKHGILKTTVSTRNFLYTLDSYPSMSITLVGHKPRTPVLFFYRLGSVVVLLSDDLPSTVV